MITSNGSNVIGSPLALGTLNAVAHTIATATFVDLDQLAQPRQPTRDDELSEMAFRTVRADRMSDCNKLDPLARILERIALCDRATNSIENLVEGFRETAHTKAKGVSVSQPSLLLVMNK